MSLWLEQDQGGFRDGVKNGTGQVNQDSELGKQLKKYAGDEKNKIFLEVGTWNGLGSTKVLFDVMKQRSDYNAGGYKFYSLECNGEKSQIARMFYSSEPTIHILNEVLSAPTEEEISKVFPEVLTDGVFWSWSNADNINIRMSKKFLEREDVPSVFDVVLLDGGEFTTYFDYQAIKDRAKILLLDDTLFNKCSRIVDLLSKDPDWKILVDVDDGKNGCVVAENLKLTRGDVFQKSNKVASVPNSVPKQALDISYDKIPVVIHHEGGCQDYFVNCVKANAKYNNIILIGDSVNEKLFCNVPNVEHVHASSLVSQDMIEFEKYFKNYSFMPEDFEKKCFLRAFYVRELLRKKSLERVFYVDSDCVVLTDVDKLFKKLSHVVEGYSVQKYMQKENPHHKVGCIHNALLTQTICDEYIRLCMNIYKSGDKFHLIKEKWELHQETKVGGICDMTLWFLLLQQRHVDSTPITDFNDLVMIDGEDCVFDHNIGDSYGYAGVNTYKMGDNPDVSPWGVTKMITKRQGKYYVMTQDGREIRLLSIHYQGGSKAGLGKNLHFDDN
jgi:hypothetical protein